MKKLFKALFTITLVLAIAYSGAWLAGAFFTKQQLANIDQQAGIEFSPASTTISGFPLWPRIEYTGRIKTAQATINVKDMNIKLGGSLSSLTANVEAMKGFTVTDHITKKTHKFSTSYLNLKLPTSPVPKNGKKDGIAQWRDEGGKIIVSSLQLKKDDINISGSGTIMLDKNLQPQGTIDLSISGYQNLLTQLSSAGIIKNIPSDKLKIANSILGALTGRKKETEKPHAFKAPLTIKNRKIYMGPMLVGKTPKIEWKR